MHWKDADEMANNVHPNQNVPPPGAVWSGYTVKILNIGTHENFAVIPLKFETGGFIIEW